MDSLLLLKGVIIGFIMASPFGPIGLVFIQRSLENEHYEGICSGLGIASGDLFYSIITTLGITFLYDIIVNHLIYLKIIAFIVLFSLSVRTLRAKVSFSTGHSHQRNLFRAYGLSFLLALYNPSTIIIFAFLFGLFDIGEMLTKTNGFILVLGIFLGSSTLWVILNHMIHHLKEVGKLNQLLLFYRFSGMLLMILSLGLLYSLISLSLGGSGL